MTDLGFKLVGIDHIVLRVVDLARMRSFYCGVLGCVVEREQAHVGLTQLRAGRSLIDLIPVDGPLGKIGGAPPGEEGRNLEHFCLAVSPFDEAQVRQHLGEQGIEVIESGERYGAEGFGYSLYIRDPEGNVVELKTSRAGEDRLG